MANVKWMRTVSGTRCGFVRETDNYLSYYQWDSSAHVFVYSTKKLSRSQYAQSLKGSRNIFNVAAYSSYQNMLDKARQRGDEDRRDFLQGYIKSTLSFDDGLNYQKDFTSKTSRRAIYPLSAAMSISGFVFPPMISHAESPAVSLPLILFVLIVMACLVCASSFVKLFTTLPEEVGGHNLKASPSSTVASYAHYNNSVHCGEMVGMCYNMGESTTSPSVDEAVMMRLLSPLAQCSDEDFDKHHNEMFDTVRSIPEAFGHEEGSNFARLVSNDNFYSDDQGLSQKLCDFKKFTVRDTFSGGPEEKKNASAVDPMLLSVRRVLLNTMGSLSKNSEPDLETTWK